MAAWARRLVAWLPAALVVPAVMGGAVVVSLPEEEGAELLELHPLDVGTTWLYDVLDHGRPSGTRTRQVTSQAGIASDLLDAVVVRSTYTDYPGRGPTTNALYVGVDERRISQHGIYQGGEYVPIEPAASAYEMPVAAGASWSYEGTVGTAALTFDVEATEVVDVEVGGRTFTDCLHYTTRSTYRYGDGSGDEEEYEEWTCPGYGPVRTVNRNEATGTEVVEELRAFHGARISWSATEPAADGAPPAPGGTSGFESGRSASVPDGVLSPELAWSDARSIAFSHPPVADGSTMVLGEEDGEVSGMRLADGEMAWRVRLSGPVVAPITLAAGRALVADTGKTLWALRTDDGAAAWSTVLDDVVSASPAADAEAAYVATDDGRVTALDLATGEVRWRSEVGARPRSAPALGGDRLVVADPASGVVTALATADGRTVWRTPLDAAVTAGPAVAEDRVLVADDQGVVHALDLADGDTAWQQRSPHDPAGGFAVGRDVVTVVGAGDRLEAFALDDGARRWGVDLPDTTTSPAVVGDQVVTVSTAGAVEVRDLADGRLRDGWPLPPLASGATTTVEVDLALVGEDLVVSADSDAEGVESTLFAYPATPGSSSGDGASDGVWFHTEVRPVPSTPAAPPVLDGEDLYVAAQDKALYRIGPDGSASTVLRSKALQPGVTVHEGLVVGQRDSEIQAFLPGEREPSWTFPATEPYIGSIPAAAGDTVFVPEYGLGLAAVSTDGVPRWFTPIDNAIGTSPPLPLPDGDVVYGSGSVARYDGTTGQPEWSMDDAQLFSTAAYDDGVVVADVIRNEHPSGLFALDADDGRVLWSHPNAANQIVAGPAIGDGVVVYGDSAGLVTAFDARTGDQLWDLQLSTPMAGSPVIRDGVVHLSERGRDFDLFQREYRISTHDLRTGEFRGAFQPPGQGYTNTPALGASKGTLLVPSTTHLGSVVMLLEPRS